MAALTGLPCEVIACILEHLGNLSSLLPPLLTCRYIYTSFKEHPSLVADTLQRQIGPDLLPYAVAALEASRLDPRTEPAVHNLLETLYTRPSELTTQLRTAPLPTLVEMGHLHDIIHSLVVEFAGNAWTLLVDDEELSVSGDLSLSPTEYFRFGRAFYRAELYFRLFRQDPSISVDFSITENDKEWFFRRHPPWVNEQLGCAHDFLELKVARASHDVLAHDVYLGELGIDYLTAGDNYHRQSWMSQGVQYIYKLANEPSWDKKKEMLESTFCTPIAMLYDTLIWLVKDTSYDQVPLTEYTDEELSRMLPAPCDRDTDRGPFEAWRIAFAHLPKGGWGMMTEHAWLRERGYVLWDMRRLEEHGMLGMIEHAPEDSALQDMERDLGSMWESFDERSQICNKGGTGYWSKGDTSGVIWPDERVQK